jgi:hypothetical protein
VKKKNSSETRTKKSTPSGPKKGEIAIVGRGEREDRFLGGEMIKISDYLYEKNVKTTTVKENLARFLKEVGGLIEDAPKSFGRFELDEIEISAELTISGEIKLIGLGGAEMEGKGGLKFTIRHKKEDGASGTKG